MGAVKIGGVEGEVVLLWGREEEEKGKERNEPAKRQSRGDV